VDGDADPPDEAAGDGDGDAEASRPATSSFPAGSEAVAAPSSSPALATAELPGPYLDELTFSLPSGRLLKLPLLPWSAREPMTAAGCA
jgi:hypothetical protein